MAVAMPSPLLELPSLRADLERVEQALYDSVRTEDPFLTEVASHLIGAGGKRVRPAFAITTAMAADPQIASVSDDVIMGGVSVELVHLGSLYHDDVMDEAEIRRNVDSVNARWGNLTAILAGDYLLAKASEIAASLGTEVAGLLAWTIGRLCEGQVLELQQTFNPDRTEGSYLSSIDGKTATLLATSTRIGAIVAGLSREQIEALTAFGHDFGMAFQIVDDILDLVATDEQLGKPSGHDLIEGVYTLPVIRTLASDTPEARSLRGAIDAHIAHVGEELSKPGTDATGPEAVSTDAVTAVHIEAAREAIREGGQVETSLATARDYVNRAVAGLKPFEGNEAATALGAAADHLLAGITALV